MDESEVIIEHPNRDKAASKATNGAARAWTAVLDSPSATINRTGLIYDKGALLLEALHKQIGDEKFLNVMRTIQGRYAWRFLTTNQVEEVFAHFDPKTDYHAFFQRYYWGTDTPDLK